MAPSVAHNKKPRHNFSHDRALLVGVQGFEPRQAESESAVLPLDDTPGTCHKRGAEYG
jgi:hypothetical protein